MGIESIEEKKAKVLMELRNYKPVKREETKDEIKYIAEDKDGNKVIVLCIIGKAVGIKHIRQIAKDMEEIGAVRALVISDGRYTRSAKAGAKKHNIELIPKWFPPFNIFEHELVPKHEILPPEEVKKLLEKYKIKPYQLPWIRASDPAVIAIGAKPGDVIKITRKSPTAGEAVVYRYVVG